MRVKFATLHSLSLNFERRKVANEGEDSGDVLSTEFLEAGWGKKKKENTSLMPNILQIFT